jgi:DNA transformation protein
VNADGIREVFADILNVRIRLMFGGHGIYDGELMFALESGGEIYLKADGETQAQFDAAGSTPFIYSRDGKPYAMSYWRIPVEALDDADLLRLWTNRAIEAARRNARKPVRRPGSRRSPVHPR